MCTPTHPTPEHSSFLPPLAIIHSVSHPSHRGSSSEGSPRPLGSAVVRGGPSSSSACSLAVSVQAGTPGQQGPALHSELARVLYCVECMSSSNAGSLRDHLLLSLTTAVTPAAGGACPSSLSTSPKVCSQQCAARQEACNWSHTPSCLEGWMRADIRPAGTIEGRKLDLLIRGFHSQQRKD